MKSPTDSCPYCGSKTGLYNKTQVSCSVWTTFHFDDSEAENGAMYDLLNHKNGKVAYCIDCANKMFNLCELK